MRDVVLARGCGACSSDILRDARVAVTNVKRWAERSGLS